MKKVISLLLVLAIAATVFAFAGCKKEDVNNSSNDAQNAVEGGSVTSDAKPIAEIKIKDYGTIKVELYPDIAPNTVANFVSLANKGFYNGLTFHRVIQDFMIQGGCPLGTGTGDPGYAIKGEFTINGFENNLSHDRGVISMARGKINDSAGSQFFICHQASPHLDGQYASFGKVIQGMDVVDAIAIVETDIYDKPLKNIVIESVSIDLCGYVAPEVETILE